MSTTETPLTPDEINRLWQHGLHEERLFHDRLNYFSALEMGLLTICGIMYNKELPIGLLLPLAGVALVFTLLWLAIQMRHWRYCVHVNKRVKALVPEYRKTIEEFSGPGRVDGFSISKPLALAAPALFALTWVVFFVWVLVRPSALAGQEMNYDRALLIGAICVIVWLAVRVERVERGRG